jgi:hypothetical protein
MAYKFDGTPNLKIVGDHVGHDGSLPRRTRTEWLSGIATFSRVCGRDPSEIVADPKHLRHLMTTASWQLAGLAPGTWSNILSRLRAMLAHAGIDVDRMRQFRLAPEWIELLAVLPEKPRRDLGSFAGWCTARRIQPGEVMQETFVAYHDYCSERKMRWEVP